VPPAGEAQPRQSRVPSLIERMTGIGRSRPAAPPAPPRAPAPPIQTSRPPTQRLAPLEEPRPAQTREGKENKQNKEEDLLDIPAFLRRQAN
jgi:cell division protein FtsZ